MIEKKVKQTCIPTTTAFKFKTGFQSSRRMLRQTFPSRSIFGWYIFCVHFTFGGSCGKFWFTAKVKTNEPPLYMPSSGSIVSVKFRMSSGFGKAIFIVFPRVSSWRSI